MATKSIYYRKMYSRDNALKTILFHIFGKISSYPRLIIEVFIRRNFGHRYFSLASVISLLLVLIFYPIASHRARSFFAEGDNGPTFWGYYLTWYAFTAAFAYFSFKRWMEVQNSPSSFDFSRFSLYAGDINPRFLKFDLFGKPNLRRVQIFYEPGLFFIGGLLLIYMLQPIGFVLILSSIIYSISYAAAYHTGDKILWDIIDDKIIRDEFQSAFVDDLLGQNTRGVVYYMTKPRSKKMRESLEDDFTENDHATTGKTYAE